MKLYMAGGIWAVHGCQVRTFTVHNSRPLLEIMITRPGCGGQRPVDLTADEAPQPIWEVGEVQRLRSETRCGLMSQWLAA